MREWSRKNKVRLNAGAAVRRAARREILRQVVADYKAAGCARCPESDLRCLQLHHRDPSTKDFNISRELSRAGIRLERFVAEVEKCIVLCANCHLKEHDGNRDSQVLAWERRSTGAPRVRR